MKNKWKDFNNIQDIFNPQHYLSGVICISQGHQYGQVRIQAINDIPCDEQVIHSVSKMHYPFNTDGRFTIDRAPSDIHVYEKMDGTAIIAYYYIFNNKKYVTYKTRLTSVLRDNAYNSFVKLWKEILNKYSQIPEIVTKDNVNLVFELYGILNKILILYDVRLESCLLFGLDRDTGDIILPDRWKKDLTTVNKYGTIRQDEDFVKTYLKLQTEVEKSNVIISDNEIRGKEGYVLYIKDNIYSYRQLKLKPPSIFKIHTQNSISKADIMTTCYNALENVDELTYEFVCELLEEEFPRSTIDKSELKIKKIMNNVIQEIRLRKDIIDKYTSLRLNVIEDKQNTMRTLSEYYKSNEIRYVYNIIHAYEQKGV